MPVLFFFALVILVIVFGPLAVIWALNTLFPVLVIPFNFWTWLAVILIGGFLRAPAGKNN